MCFSTFNAIALPLARVSTFCVDDETVNGPRDELELYHLENFLIKRNSCITSL